MKVLVIFALFLLLDLSHGAALGVLPGKNHFERKTLNPHQYHDLKPSTKQNTSENAEQIISKFSSWARSRFIQDGPNISKPIMTTKDTHNGGQWEIRRNSVESNYESDRTPDMLTTLLSHLQPSKSSSSQSSTKHSTFIPFESGIFEFIGQPNEVSKNRVKSSLETVQHDDEKEEDSSSSSSSSEEEDEEEFKEKKKKVEKKNDDKEKEEEKSEKEKNDVSRENEVNDVKSSATNEQNDALSQSDSFDVSKSKAILDESPDQKETPMEPLIVAEPESVPDEPQTGSSIAPKVTSESKSSSSSESKTTIDTTSQSIKSTSSSSNFPSTKHIELVNTKETISSQFDSTNLSQTSPVDPVSDQPGTQGDSKSSPSLVLNSTTVDQVNQPSQSKPPKTESPQLATNELASEYDSDSDNPVTPLETEATSKSIDNSDKIQQSTTPSSEKLPDSEENSASVPSAEHQIEFIDSESNQLGNKEIVETESTEITNHNDSVTIEGPRETPKSDQIDSVSNQLIESTTSQGRIDSVDSIDTATDNAGSSQKDLNEKIDSTPSPDGEPKSMIPVTQGEINESSNGDSTSNQSDSIETESSRIENGDEIEPSTSDQITRESIPAVTPASDQPEISSINSIQSTTESISMHPDTSESNEEPIAESTSLQATTTKDNYVNTENNLNDSSTNEKDSSATSSDQSASLVDADVNVIEQNSESNVVQPVQTVDSTPEKTEQPTAGSVTNDVVEPAPTPVVDPVVEPVDDTAAQKPAPEPEPVPPPKPAPEPVTEIVTEPPFQCPPVSVEDEYIGLFQDPKDCSAFYQCSNGVPVRKSCPRTLVFDAAENVCNYPDNTDLSGCVLPPPPPAPAPVPVPAPVPAPAPVSDPEMI